MDSFLGYPLFERSWTPNVNFFRLTSPKFWQLYGKHIKHHHHHYPHHHHDCLVLPIMIVAIARMVERPPRFIVAINLVNIPLQPHLQYLLVYHHSSFVSMDIRIFFSYFFVSRLHCLQPKVFYGFLGSDNPSPTVGPKKWFTCMTRASS